MKKILPQAILCLTLAILFVSCSKKDAPDLPFMEVSRSSVIFTAKAGSDTLTIRSNLKWQITAKPNWLGIDPWSGSGNTTVRMFLERNYSPDSLTGTVTVTAEGYPPVVVNVAQLNSTDLVVDSKDLEVPSAGIIDTIDFFTTDPWNLEIWDHTFGIPRANISADAMSGPPGNNRIILTIAPSDDISDRRSGITIRTGSPVKDSVSIRIHQEAPVKIKSYPVSATGGEEINIHGSGFSFNPSDIIVTINGVRAELTSCSSFDLGVRVPFKVGDGFINVKVRNESGVSATKLRYNWKGRVSVLAGGIRGYRDGLGTKAEFHAPGGLGLDNDGNIIVADYINKRVRKVTPEGRVSTLPGRLIPKFPGESDVYDGPGDVAVDSKGNIFVTEINSGMVSQIRPDGGVSVVAGKEGSYGSIDGPFAEASFMNPLGICLDEAGNPYVFESFGHRVRKIWSHGYVSTIAGSLQSYADGSGASAHFNMPYSGTFDHNGNLFVTDFKNNYLRIISPSNVVMTYTTEDQGKVRFNGPADICTDSHGNIFFTDSDNFIHWVDREGKLASVKNFVKAETGETFRFYGIRGIVVSKSDVIYVTDQSNDLLYKIVLE